MCSYRDKGFIWSFMRQTKHNAIKTATFFSILHKKDLFFAPTRMTFVWSLMRQTKLTPSKQQPNGTTAAKSHSFNLQRKTFSAYISFVLIVWHTSKQVWPYSIHSPHPPRPKYAPNDLCGLIPDTLVHIASSWGSQLNAEKCCVTRFSRKKFSIEKLDITQFRSYYVRGGGVCRFLDSCKDLGILVNTQLKLHEHIRSILEKKFWKVGKLTNLDVLPF